MKAHVGFAPIVVAFLDLAIANLLNTFTFGLSAAGVVLLAWRSRSTDTGLGDTSGDEQRSASEDEGDGDGDRAFALVYSRPRIRRWGGLSPAAKHVGRVPETGPNIGPRA